MLIRILSVCGRMPPWVDEACAQYIQRLGSNWRIDITNIPMSQRHKNGNVQDYQRQETERIIKQTKPGEYRVALDERGQTYNTLGLQEQMETISTTGGRVCFYIGGPDGLSPSCLQHADASWSLSALTLPHPLARVVLVEQLYRTWALIQGHPYHRS